MFMEKGSVKCVNMRYDAEKYEKYEKVENFARS